MTRWDPTAQLDRDDPFEMLLKTCRHLRAEGMSRPTLFAMHAPGEEPEKRKQPCLRLRKVLRSTADDALRRRCTGNVQLRHRTFQKPKNIINS